jgi:peroxiredoxin
MIRDRIFPDQIHNYAHNNEWLVRSLGHVGRIHDAIDLAKNMSELPRHPKLNSLSMRKCASYARTRLFEDLTRFELWNDLIALCETQYLEPTEIATEQVKRLRRLGSAFIRSGEVARGRTQLAELERRLAHEQGLPEGAELRPEPVSLPSGDDGKFPAKSDAEKERETRVRPLNLAIDEVRGHLYVSRGEFDAALRLLKRAGGVDPIYLARLEWEAGRKGTALKDVRSAVDSKKGQVQPLAGLVELLWRAGERQEAAERFAELRELAAHADLDAPPLARLAPIAAALGLPSDWRIVKSEATDVGDRPPLDSLGPFRWSPPPAPHWTLTDGAGQEFSLSQYRGRPVVLIFYLGYQCLHCAEQLQKFAPLTQEFQSAGIALLAISTDDHAGLQKSIENYKPGVFPFPLTSNATLDVFRAYKVYDDFENKPLHGTFFIDGAGLVRWHDIGYEPFQDPRFLLNEAKRLLGLPSK